MGDHFWPSIFPAIAIGLIYGYSRRGIRNIMLGGLGALIAAFVAFTVLEPVLAADGLFPMLALLAIALAGAFGMTRLGSWLTTR